VFPTTAALGDPVTLRLHVTGSGNFDRVDSPMLEHLDHWRTYPPTPSFKPSDSIGYTGAKTFEQPLIARVVGHQDLPALRFSYFDPAAGRYVTVSAPALAVTIAPAVGGAAPASVVAAATAVPAAARAGADAALPVAQGAAPLPELRADHRVDGRARSLVPLYLQPRFLGMPAALCFLFVGAWWRGQRRGRVAAARLSPAVARRLAGIETAARDGDSPAFFAAARAAVRDRLASRWKIPPDAVTEAVVAARLGNSRPEIHELFKLADAMLYSGATSASGNLARWTEIVRAELLRGGPP